MAQVKVCSDDLESAECKKCISTFGGISDKMQQMMCFAKEKRSGSSCDFTSCPDSLSEIEACVRGARKLTESKAVDHFTTRYSNLMVKLRAEICGPEGVEKLATEFATIGAAFVHYDRLHRGKFNLCIAGMTADRNKIIDRFNAEGATSGYSILDKRDADSDLTRLYKIAAFSINAKMFALGPEFSRIESSLKADVLACRN